MANYYNLNMQNNLFVNNAIHETPYCLIDCLQLGHQEGVYCIFLYSPIVSAFIKNFP